MSHVLSGPGLGALTPGGALLLGACVGAFSPVHQVGTSLSPPEAERRLEAAFVSFGIPVSERAVNGRVSSGRFDPTARWGTLAVDRVTCGVAGKNGATPQVHELEVVGTIRLNARGSNWVELESYGSGRDEHGKVIQCRLAEASADAILASVAHQGEGTSQALESTGGGEGCEPQRRWMARTKAW
jgi:hypothetical protein